MLEEGAEVISSTPVRGEGILTNKLFFTGIESFNLGGGGGG